MGNCAEVVALCWQVITGLKQRIFRLEQQCKEKDNAIKYDLRGLVVGGPQCLLGVALGQERLTSPLHPFHLGVVLPSCHPLFHPKTEKC